MASKLNRTMTVLAVVGWAILIVSYMAVHLYSRCEWPFNDPKCVDNRARGQ